jgi:hypothetical protein
MSAVPHPDGSLTGEVNVANGSKPDSRIKARKWGHPHPEESREGR